MIKRWNVKDIENQLSSMAWSASDPNMDGFVTWPIKQDLYKLRWAVEDALAKCPEYSTEKLWLDEQENQREQDKILRILKS